MIKLYALRWAPPGVQGLVRDLGVRWALGEAGLGYEEQRDRALHCRALRGIDATRQCGAHAHEGLDVRSPELDRAYRQRCEARPAFAKALAAQLAAFAA